jgi:hypothetical protein
MDVPAQLNPVLSIACSVPVIVGPIEKRCLLHCMVHFISDSLVTCHVRESCSENISITTQEMCCNNLIAPFGFSYQSDGVCFQCPTG